MKLAECLLQEKSIRHARHRDKGIWFDPKIKKYGDKLCITTSDIYNLHTLSPEDFVSDDWEIKPEPMKVEFECIWRRCPEFDHYYPTVDTSEFIDIVNLEKSGKRFKVTCEEIDE